MKVLSEIREDRLTTIDAAGLLGLSLRHTRRLLAAFRRRGPAALAHGNRGRPPHNRLPDALRQRVLRWARTAYPGFNHQHLTEALVEERELHISYWTVHRWLVAAGLPSPHPRRPRRHYRRRERMPQEGLLVQVDASHHDWLEGRGPRLALHGAIDDASNYVPAAVFRAEEDAAGYFWILRDLLRLRGRPIAIYGDRHGIFHRDPRQPLTLAQQLRGVRRPLTQFGRALQELGIRWIPASSPQAKGRIERLWGTFQDRLVSELRRARVRTLAEANAALARFLPRYNARFAHAPTDPHHAYRPLTLTQRLEDICCFAYERTVANDNTVQVGEHQLQILPTPRRASYAKARVIVREHLDGTLSVSDHAERLRVQPLPPSAQRGAPRTLRARDYARLTSAPRAQPTKKAKASTHVSHRGKPPYRPAADHPWRLPLLKRPAIIHDERPG
ncbi:MAG: ISNCY family transposase [Terriglobales bacterium]